ncbi:glycosyltransferase [Vibrio cyclitrophicus]|uniref:glycosyltransferase n=3 Tax=Vibrio cyclitrophicus TaxID=47951 RepID=UPI00029A2CFA|nr:glycosyltransferase [Vibrio cyclitrophicus]OED68553.1 glycosyl transferase [Vibrio cyclitrophicus ZF99]OED75975.1 glycosyl transferase [Vibrio cyclitrophicus ZF65]OEE21916.1 glycosyl transferase [Vibrio cyclitrophicus ZF14]PME41948.1 glycosyl transferase [Vibrio cyclitrophicus]PME54125.1 glycosyl transferase [Vibrio cyclitrophicus]
MIKKMVFVISALRGGGAEKFVLNLYKAMEKYQGYECHIVAIEKAVEHDIDGYRVHFVSDFCNVSKKGLRRLWYKKSVAQSIDDYIKTGIGENVLILSNMLLADKIMSQSQLHVYHVIHSPYNDAFLRGKSFVKKLQIRRKISNWYKNHPLVFVSEHVKSSFECVVKNHKSSCVIPNPVNVDIDNKDVPKISGDYLVHVGRFNREKRHDRLIEIFNNVKDSKVKLLLIGDGKLKTSIKSDVEKKGLGDRVIFMGFKSNPYRYIKESKGLLLTSDFEGLSMVLLEAIYLKVPVLTTDCSKAIRSVVINNQTSLVPIDDIDLFSKKIDELLIEPDKFLSEENEIFHPRFVAQQYNKLAKNV